MTSPEIVLHGFAFISLLLFVGINAVEIWARRYYKRNNPDQARPLFALLSIFYTHHDLLDKHLKKAKWILIIMLTMHIILSVVFVVHDIYLRS